jgi:hypothetical protein
LDYGIPAEAVANLGLRSLTAAAIAECSPFGWAILILVVTGCNVTSVFGVYVDFAFRVVDRRGRARRWKEGTLVGCMGSVPERGAAGVVVVYDDVTGGSILIKIHKVVFAKC